MKEIAPPKKNTIIKNVRQSPVERRPIAIALGPVVPSALPPHPDLSDTATTLAGFLKRAASDHPVPDPEVLNELGSFVENWLEKNLIPLPADADTSVESWLAKTSYPQWRKAELMQKYEQVTNRFDKKYERAKCFCKDEFYPDFKPARGIYSRSDEFKVFVGPIFKLIEEEVYKRPEFIKHVPVAERPAYIKEFLAGDGPAYSTDYTAYESQFRRLLMEKTEFKLYSYMTKYIAAHEFDRHISAIKKRQICVFKWFTAEIDTCRLSGEMNTSLGNGFSNLMFALFVAYKKGCTHVKMVVEGDDGLMKKNGPNLCEEDFVPLGLSIKMEVHDSIETASFCGLIFDSEELINITDPREPLATLGWASREYVRAKKTVRESLLRCKALSLAHQYPGCPILSSFAHYVLRNTRHVRMDALMKRASKMSMWDREQVLAAIRDEKKIVVRPPGPRSRALMEQKFDVPIGFQIAIEKYFNGKVGLGPTLCAHVDAIMPDSWKDFSLNYVRFVEAPEVDQQVFAQGEPGVLSRLLAMKNVIWK